MKIPSTLPILLAILLIGTAPDALAGIHSVSAPNTASDGLHAVAWGIAWAGLFIGIGLALGRRK